MADSVARQAAPGRASSGRVTGRNQRPALHDARCGPAGHPVAPRASGPSELDRFRGILGRAASHASDAIRAGNAEADELPPQPVHDDY